MLVGGNGQVILQSETFKVEKRIGEGGGPGRAPVPLPGNAHTGEAPVPGAGPHR